MITVSHVVSSLIVIILSGSGEIKYPLFWSLKYIESFIVLWIFSSIRFSIRQIKIIFFVCLIGATWVSFYALLQYYEVVPIRQENIRTGYRYIFGNITSTLAVSYFQLSVQSVLTFCIGVSLFSLLTNKLSKFFVFSLSLFSVVGAILSGARAGPVMFFIVIFVVVVLSWRKKLLLVILIASISIAFFIFMFSSSAGINSITMERLSDTPIIDEEIDHIKESDSSVLGRIIEPFSDMALMLDTFGLEFLFFGNGYMLQAPKRTNIHSHNIFLWSLEHGGIFMAFGMLFLWYRLLKILFLRFRSSKNNRMYYLIISAIGFITAVTLVGFSGQVFWFYIGLENNVVYQMLFYSIAVVYTTENKSYS